MSEINPISEFQLDLFNYNKELSGLLTFATSISDFIKEKKESLASKPDKPSAILWDVDNSNNYNIIFNIHWNLYKSFCVTNHSNFEARLAVLEAQNPDSNFHNAIQKFRDAENEWNSFLKDLDAEAGWNIDSDYATLSCELSGIELESFTNQEEKVSLLELILPDSSISNHLAVLSSFRDKLTDFNCQVIVLTAGVREGVKRWQNETRCIFPVYLDQSDFRKAYARFGMNKSLYRSRCTSTVRLAIEQVQAKRSNDDFEIWLQHKEWNDITDDQLQMAGDIVFDSNGQMVFQHIMQHPFDRPSVIGVINEIEAAIGMY